MSSDQLTYDYVLIGCGYLGRRVLDLIQTEHTKIAVLTRSKDKAKHFSEQGIDTVIGNITDRKSLDPLPIARTWIYAVGYDRRSDLDRRLAVVEGLQNIAHLAATRSQRFLMTSSTSVYGIQDGSLVDESTPCEPETENGQHQLEAEQVATSECASSSTSLSILRLAGIYGPDRLLTRLDKLHSGNPFDGQAEAWLNLIHVDDAARFLVELDSQEDNPGIVLVADDEPVQRKVFYTELASRIGSPKPIFTGQHGPSTRTLGLNKRCNNTTMKRLLNQPLQYPTFREGLLQSLEENGSSIQIPE